MDEQAQLNQIRQARDMNMRVLMKAFEDYGIHVTTKAIDQNRFALRIPQSKYDHAILEKLIRYQRLEFYRVSKTTSYATSYVLKDKNQEQLFLDKRPVLSGSAILHALADRDRQSGQPMLAVTLDDRAAEKMLTFTRENIGRRMAVVLRTAEDANVLSVATIQGEFGKRFMITQLDSLDEAHYLATVLRAGELAVPMYLVDEPNQTMSPKYRQSSGDYN